MRNKVIAGNWKMNKTMQEVQTIYEGSKRVQTT